MINSIFRALIKVVFFILRWLFNLLLLPLKPLMLIFPTFDDFLEDAIYFFDTYIIKAVGFAKEVFLNMTGFPQTIITISVDFALLLLGYIVTLRMITFVTNMWRKFKGGES